MQSYFALRFCSFNYLSYSSLIPLFFLLFVVVVVFFVVVFLLLLLFSSNF